jgi:hypothetical protein
MEDNQPKQQQLVQRNRATSLILNKSSEQEEQKLPQQQVQLEKGATMCREIIISQETN